MYRTRAYRDFFWGASRRTGKYPTYARFMESDPIGYQGSPNLYAYVSNDPLNSVDPLGLAQDTTPAAIVVTACQNGGVIGINGSCGPGPGALDMLPTSITFGDTERGVPAGYGCGSGECNVTVRHRKASLRNLFLNLFSDAFNKLERAFCTVPSYELGGEAAYYHGWGSRVSGALAYNPSSGDLLLKGSFGGGIGFGGGGAFGLSMQSSATSAGVQGTVDSRVAAGSGVLGIDVTHNWVSYSRGQNVGSQGTSGSVGIAKAYGEAYVAIAEVNISGATRIGNLGTVCD